jgi:hypothetical protein
LGIVFSGKYALMVESTVSLCERNVAKVDWMEVEFVGSPFGLVANTGFCVTLNWVMGTLTALVTSPMTSVFIACAV